MTVKTPSATLLLLMMCGTSGASAQPLTEPRDPMQQRLKTGDRVSVHTPIAGIMLTAPSNVSYRLRLWT